MSPAKYLAIQELLNVDETATLEEYSDATIRQIRQRTQECQQEHEGTDENGQGQSHGQGQGHGHHGGW
jgi:hypothetical protein